MSTAEKEQRDRFAGFYQRNQLPVMQLIERSVCGCDYGGTSWTTRDEADMVSDALGLEPGQQLLDLGAGSGWPGLYLAASSGCDVTLVDLPPEGLMIAAGRARTDELHRCNVIAADASALPCNDNVFDAVTHSDLLCCLPGKQQALAECRRVIRDNGRMIFSVIYVAPGLSEADAAIATDAGPMFIASETDYSGMLRATDWTISQVTDLTIQFRDSARNFQIFDQANRQEFINQAGEDAWQWRQNKNARLVEVVDAGLLRRELFNVLPN